MTKVKRFSWIIIAMLIALLLLQKQLWISDSGLWAIHELNNKIATETQQNEQLQTRNQKVLLGVVRLKSGDAGIETRARTELGLIKQGEIFYQIVSS